VLEAIFCFELCANFRGRAGLTISAERVRNLHHSFIKERAVKVGQGRKEGKKERERKREREGERENTWVTRGVKQALTLGRRFERNPHNCSQPSSTLFLSTESVEKERKERQEEERKERRKTLFAWLESAKKERRRVLSVFVLCHWKERKGRKRKERRFCSLASTSANSLKAANSFKVRPPRMGTASYG
jgi:hypothetical protein